VGEGLSPLERGKKVTQENRGSKAKGEGVLSFFGTEAKYDRLKKITGGGRPLSQRTGDAWGRVTALGQEVSKIVHIRESPKISKRR